jgi:hypothetical protein
MNNRGWVKMRGKKCKVLNCGCCVVENRRDDVLWKEAANEINYVVSGQAESDDWYDAMVLENETTFAEEMAAFGIEPRVDPFTLAKYTWGVGMSDPRISAILAQRHADHLKRFADIYDAMHDGRDIEEIIRAA